MRQQKIDQIQKIMMVGTREVDTRGVLTRYIDGTPPSSYKSTFDETKLLVLGDVVVRQDIHILRITESLDSQRRGYHSMLLCFDLTNKNSFQLVCDYYRQKSYSTYTNTTPKNFLLVGMNADKEHERVVDQKQAQDFAEQNGLTYVEVSAQTGDNVEKAFVTICREYLQTFTQGQMLLARQRGETLLPKLKLQKSKLEAKIESARSSFAARIPLYGKHVRGQRIFHQQQLTTVNALIGFLEKYKSIYQVDADPKIALYYLKFAVKSDDLRAFHASRSLSAIAAEIGEPTDVAGALAVIRQCYAGLELPEISSIVESELANARSVSDEELAVSKNPVHLYVFLEKYIENTQTEIDALTPPKSHSARGKIALKGNKILAARQLLDFMGSYKNQHAALPNSKLVLYFLKNKLDEQLRSDFEAGGMSRLGKLVSQINDDATIKLPDEPDQKIKEVMEAQQGAHKP